MQTRLDIRKGIDWRKVTIEIISYAFVILFIYAGLYKLLDFKLFRSSIEKSPLIASYAGLLIFLVPIGEIIVAGLLIFQKTRMPGLLLSTLIMAGFTAYIYYMLNFSPDIPCSCGGILAKMGWHGHLIFNACFTVLGAIAVYLQKYKIKHI